MVHKKVYCIIVLIAERDALRNAEPAGKWLSCVALLCQTFSEMRVTSDKPLELLAKPVFELLSLCVSADASDSELACAAMQV